MFDERPDFVVVGGQFEGKVVLLASKTLAYMELEEVARDLPTLTDYLYGNPFTINPKIDIFIRTKVKDYVMIWADNYPAAWEELFKVWNPVDQQEISGQKAIER